VTKATNVRSGRTVRTPGTRKKPNVAPVAAVSILTVTTVDDPVTVSTSGTVDADGHLSSGSLNWGDGTVITWTGVPATSYSHTFADGRDLHDHADGHR
jgi:hypothetical protein